VIRMIERWFPCAEVSEASVAGWGSGNTERNLFTWFAARPVAQAKAAVLTSLLPWPENESEQVRLQELVRQAMTGRYAAWRAIHDEIFKHNGDDVSVLDPFSGRGMIPLEAARLGLHSYGIDYSPIAVLGSNLLTNYALRDWTEEPPIPFKTEQDLYSLTSSRLLPDVAAVLEEIGRRHALTMSEFYPEVDGKAPWGYLWAVAQPCQECGRRFPVVGSYELRKPSIRKGRRGEPDRVDPGQSFYIETDTTTGSFSAVVHDGVPVETPTFANQIGEGGKKIKGKSAICPFCGHVHPLATHQRLAQEGLCVDALLVVADIDKDITKSYRIPFEEEFVAAAAASAALDKEKEFSPGVPPVPNEEIPLNNGATIRPQLYGAKTYGDLMCDRQTLSFVKLARVIDNIGLELRAAGLSHDYAAALCGYAVAAMFRKLKRSTRGTNLDVSRQSANHIFVNESTIAHSQDFFETGIGEGPGTWDSLAGSTLSTLRNLLADARGRPTQVSRGSALALPFSSRSITAVVTDPPYDAMVYYSDSSDLFYAWAKRALSHIDPLLSLTTDPRGLQEKTEEIIVKEHGKSPGEHRDREHYDKSIATAFSEMRRVVTDDGLVTIVFGHGEPEVWKRLLGAISSAGLVMTGSWPARTEAGGQQGKANIETTLTMCCRPVTADRPEGRKASVEAAVKREVGERMDLWTRSGLAPTDMLMASAGPAMEVVGRYSRVLDAKGEPVEIDVFLPIARRAVEEAESIEIDHHPLETFDARTRFALWWVRLFGRQLTPKSELRWQSLASSLDLAEVRDLVPDATKGCQFVEAAKFTHGVDPTSSVIDVALTMARRWPDGLDSVGEVLAEAGRDSDDAYLWSAMAFLADRLPDSDSDAIAWTGILRNRRNVGHAAHGVTTAKKREREDANIQQAQGAFEFHLPHGEGVNK